jgi:hypothetical protein
MGYWQKLMKTKQRFPVAFVTENTNKIIKKISNYNKNIDNDNDEKDLEYIYIYIAYKLLDLNK